MRSLSWCTVGTHRKCGARVHRYMPVANQFACTSDNCKELLEGSEVKLDKKKRSRRRSNGYWMF